VTVVRVPDSIRRRLEDLLPWYDRDAMRAHNEYSDQLLLEASISRRNAIRVRNAYTEGATRLGRQ
jgi:hypothetical protein